MAYTRPQHLGTHGERRVIGILTLTNIVGGLGGLGGLWMLAGLLGLGGDQPFTAAWLLRLALAALGGGAGVMATFRWSGISLWDQVVLWGGYQLRRAMGRTLLRPPAPARAARAHALTALTRGGTVIAAVYDPGEERAPATEAGYGA